jgi:4,5-DOPA dioxygenase extradiol
MAFENSERNAQIVYLSHGGGPLPILGDESHKAMIDFMTALSSQLKRPDVILVISAHWEERSATLLGAQHPPMFYDYYGFPAEAYKIQYSAPGSPTLANQIARLLEKENIPSRVDPDRGFDHGLFIPLKMMYPEADIPAIQLSLLRGLDAGAHVALGRALRSLNDTNILVIGSGFSFHNMNAFFSGGTGGPDAANDAFQDWLIHVTAGSLSQSEREQLLIEWKRAPSARYCHPREEHLLPLHVCVGMGDRPGTLIFDDQILNKRSVAFLW